MSSAYQRGIRSGLRAIASPWLLSLAAAFLVASVMLHDVARVTHRAVELGRRLALARAHLRADHAALQEYGAPTAGDLSSTDGDVCVHRADGKVVVAARDPNGTTHYFEAQELPGAAPQVLGKRLVVGDLADRPAGAEAMDAADVPRCDPRQLAAAAQTASTPLLRRDPGVALAYWQAGTDREDFVLASGAGTMVLDSLAPLFVVPGHLWVPPASAPLELHLRRDLVVVVEGNLYLGRTVRVHGPGRLLFAAMRTPAAAPFVDRDGNGRWSAGEPSFDVSPHAGPIEGAGNVYLGLRGASTSVTFDIGLVVAGQLHLLAAAAVAGPVVVAHGVTSLRSGASLDATGQWRFAPEREGVPGFVTSGSPRPSRLRYLGDDSTFSATMGKQPLYLPASPR